MGSIDKTHGELMQALGRLEEVLERNIISQDRLARTQMLLAFIGVVITLLQLVGMFIIPQ